MALLASCSRSAAARSRSTPATTWRSCCGGAGQRSARCWRRLTSPIDGPFVAALADGAGEWRGSSNQRVWARAAPAATLTLPAPTRRRNGVTPGQTPRRTGRADSPPPRSPRAGRHGHHVRLPQKLCRRACAARACGRAAVAGGSGGLRPLRRAAERPVARLSERSRSGVPPGRRHLRSRLVRTRVHATRVRSPQPEPTQLRPR